MPQFDATIKNIKEGVKGFTVSAAVKNIEGWETTLEKSELSGVKTIVKDLETLKKHLQADDVSGDKVKEILAKLGKATTNLASKEDGPKADKAKELGDAISKMAGA